MFSNKTVFSKIERLMSDIGAFKERTDATLDFGFEVKEAAICDMLENFTQALETCGNKGNSPYAILRS